MTHMKRKTLIFILLSFTGLLSFAQSISYNHLCMLATAQTLSETNDSIKSWNYRLIDSSDKGLIYGWGNFTSPSSNVPWAIICIQIQGYIKFVTWNFSSQKAYQQICRSVRKSADWKQTDEDTENDEVKLTYENHGCCIFLNENPNGWYKVTYSYFDKNKFIKDHPVPEDWNGNQQNK